MAAPSVIVCMKPRIILSSVALLLILSVTITSCGKDDNTGPTGAGQEECACGEQIFRFPNDSFMVAVPNIFTPNGNGVNDVFNFVTLGSSSYTFRIFDSDSNTLGVFNPIYGWNGTRSATNNTATDLAPDGKYSVVINVTFENGTDTSFTASTCLVSACIIEALKADDCYYRNQFDQNHFNSAFSNGEDLVSCAN
jgi:hypothetical protein